jgi:hypothetical protein
VTSLASRLLGFPALRSGGMCLENRFNGTVLRWFQAVPDGDAAIVGAPVGAGYAVLLGIEPSCRAVFVQTGQLIANLILPGAERRCRA